MVEKGEKIEEENFPEHFIVTASVHCWDLVLNLSLNAIEIERLLLSFL
jgi:hypothetical protein